MAKNWYVVHAYSGYEKKVANALRERIELHDMQEYFGDVLVPTEEVVEIRGGQKESLNESFSQAMFWFRWSLMTIAGIW